MTRLAARHGAFGPSALGERRRRSAKAAGLLTPDLPAASAERPKRPPKRPPGDGGVWRGPEAAAWVAAHLGLAKARARRGWAAPRRIGWPPRAHAAAAACARGEPRAQRAAEQRAASRGGLEEAVARAGAAHPDQPLEAWAAGTSIASA